MRDVLAVTSVIVVAICIGVVGAYLSVDLTPPGLELIRPPKPEVAAQLERENQQQTIAQAASGCKYCVAMADLAQTFARHAKSARQRANALETAIVLDKKAGDQAGQLAMAVKAADGAEAAAESLTLWASRCKAEDFCRVPVTPISRTSCSDEDQARAASTVLVAAAIRKSAQGCVSASCPLVDCQATAKLRGDAQHIENSLAASGFGASTSVGLVPAAHLPVGASTLSAELKRIGDESVYVTKMLPLLLDKSKTGGDNGQMTKLVPEMIDERAVSASRLAAVMAEASRVSDTKSGDPRMEASWRLKSLAANLATLGKEAQLGDIQGVNWSVAADALGGALTDLARLQSMLDRSKGAKPGVESCANSIAAVRMLNEATAMLDLCRMRSSCVGAGGAGSVIQASGGRLDDVMQRAQSTAEKLLVQELKQPELLDVSDDAALMQPAEAVRAQGGVCRRAAEFREASSAAPDVTQAVVQAAGPQLLPAGAPVAPQDLVAGAIDAAIEGGTAQDANADLVHAADPVAPEPSGEELIPATAPAANANPSFTGSLYSGDAPAPAFVGPEGAEPPPAPKRR